MPYFDHLWAQNLQRIADAVEFIAEMMAEKKKEEIVDISSIDVVPVVRCKDCEHYRDGACEQIAYIMDGYYHGTFEIKKPDDFCSDGKKKDGKEERA